MALEVECLSFDYGGPPVLREVSFRLPEGSFLGLLGPNGTGKTTLLTAIGMLRRPGSGRCLLAGKDLARLSPRERAKMVAYLPQDTHSPFPQTVMEAVLLGRSPHALFTPGEKDRRAAAAALERLGLETRAFREVGSLRGGERQRVVLARALAQRPRLLLLDEPTSSLDLKNQLGVMGLVRDLCRNEGLMAVASIHDLNLAATFCDHFLLLKDAASLAWGGAEVLTPKNIQAVYGVPVAVAELAGRRVIVPLTG